MGQLPLETYTRAMEYKRKEHEPAKKRKASGEVKTNLKTDEQKLIDEIHDSLTHHYKSIEGAAYVEAHVDMVYTYSDADDIIGLPKLDDPERGGVGGWLSCRILPCIRPVCVIGQDEVIFHPSTMNENCWKIDEVSPLRSKGGTGNGKMVSGTKTRKHGFGGPKLTEADFKKVNDARQGQSYGGYALKQREIFLEVQKNRNLPSHPSSG